MFNLHTHQPLREGTLVWRTLESIHLDFGTESRFLGGLILLLLLFFPRTTALLLSVSHLVLVTRNACHLTGGLDWIDQSLSAAEEHLEVLREAALASQPEKGLLGPEGFLQEQSAI